MLDINRRLQKFCGGEIPKGAPRGAVYLQDGKYYGGSGKEIIRRRAANPKPAVEPESAGTLPTWPTAPGSYASMHWTKLRQEMQSRGQVWTNREAAVAYLTEKDAGESQAEDDQAENAAIEGPKKAIEAIEAIDQPSDNPE